jgi:hypothetical protein
VERLLRQLRRAGLVWADGPGNQVIERVRDSQPLRPQEARPLAAVARSARAYDVRSAAAAIGAPPADPRKDAAVAALLAFATDRAALAAAIRALRPSVRDVLVDRALGSGRVVFGGTSPAERTLIAAGLALPVGPRVEVPREIVVEALFVDAGMRVRGRPEIPGAATGPDPGRAGAEAGLRATTVLLDEARRAPVARTKKGGVGVRERARLEKLGVTAPALAIDIAVAASLLGGAAPGLVPSAEYDAWRDAEPGPRWARLALAWWGLAVSPTHRIEGDVEIAPPLRMESAAGIVRRGVLRAAADGRSLGAVIAHADWFAPAARYDPDELAERAAALRREGELLGVVSGDRLTELGELLVELADTPQEAELGARAAASLPPVGGGVVLQSDLTAVVTGQATAATSALLAAAAVPEQHGVATIHRITAASLRAALDVGWTEQSLRAGFAEMSDGPLPQPMDYLIRDVARTHGVIRVRATTTVVVAPEAVTAEIAHTRGLRGVTLHRIAPTVLTAHESPEAVLTALRRAGFAPMQDADDGTLVVPTRAPEQVRARPARTERPRRPIADLVHALRAGPTPTDDPGTEDQAMAALLVDAVQQGRAVRIVYRNAAGNNSDRIIEPTHLMGDSVWGYCHLRRAERVFSMRGIRSVDPA